MSLLANSNAIESGGYNIDRSLRFRSSASAYLDRTLTTPTNNKIYTWSGWVKKGIIGTANRKVLFSARNGTNEDYFCYDDTTDNLRFFVNSTNASTTSAVYRDASAWYHVMLVVDTTQSTAANRVSIYVNGTLAANANGTAPTQNSNTVMNGAYSHRQGAASYNGPWYFDGYLAEVNFIDGQALTPSSFGQTDPVTGVWTPKKYTGTYGTNGFYLNFSDNTSATTLAYDKSGNSNNWTANNISTTAGATYDSMTDVPTLTSATAANYCTLNPLTTTTTALVPAQGNLYFGNNATYNSSVNGTIGVSSGKWYWEVQADSNYCMAGITALSYLPANIAPHQVGSQAKIYYSFNGQKYDNGNNAIYGATWTTTDIIGVALDLDSGTLTFYKNNTSQGTAYTGLSGTYWPVFGGANGANVGWINFGQRPFSYTPPTGFKALNTFNLPDPTIKKPNQYMDVSKYTGTGTTQTVANSGGFTPDFVWIKNRSHNDADPYYGVHLLFNSTTGVGNRLMSQSTAAEAYSSQSLTAFNSGGFTVGTDSSVSYSGDAFVGWQWKESATAGFDIVTYTGTGSATTVAHSLGVAPKMIIVKKRSAADSWQVYHANLTSAAYRLVLNATNAQDSQPTIWNSTAPTSSVFSVGTDSGVNTNGGTYVAYLFAEIAGFSKFGSYTGNGSADGVFCYTGMRPKFVMVKRTDTAGYDWKTYDTSRDTYNLTNHELDANLSAAETTAGSSLDINSNGFKLRDSTAGINANGGTYIFCAFAENPFKYSNAR